VISSDAPHERLCAVITSYFRTPYHPPGKVNKSEVWQILAPVEESVNLEELYDGTYPRRFLLPKYCSTA
jgi:hypothetical protein